MVLTTANPPEEVLRQHLLENCQQSKKDIEVLTQEAVESIDKLNLQDELDLNALLSESNVFIDAINDTVYQLRDIFLHVNIETNTKQSLLTITQKFDEIAHSVSSSYSDEPAKLQSALQTNVQDVSVEAVNLFNLLETGALKEREQDYLDILCYLLLAVERITARNEIIHLKPEEITKLLIGLSVGMKESFGQFSSENKHLLDVLTHHMKFACRVEGKIVFHLYKQVEYYDGDAAKDFLHTSREMYNLINRMQDVYDNPHSVDYFIATTNSNVGTGCEIIAKLGTHVEGNDAKSIQSIKEAFYHACSLTIATGRAVPRAFKILARLY